ncbi:MAG: hypothetical protein A4E63_00892 [Syntrophorhabdus sp. PtaU1.Bin050]|nr:MAG: hypothetical protein A4E63_00892 [Syntrophorhabdus sp. PtaU1.Bin050]
MASRRNAHNIDKLTMAALGMFVFYSLAMMYNNTNRQVPIMNSRKI